MPVAGPEAGWRILHHGVTGPHKARCQDYAEGRTLVVDDGPRSTQVLLLAAADGHGASPHSRSHHGARFAVEVFLGLAGEFAERAVRGQSLPRLRAEAQQRMPHDIVRAWEERCAEHLREHPLDTPPPAADEPPKRRDLLPYGTTLVGAVLTPGLVAAWQLGDGELTLVGQDTGGPLLPLAPVHPELGDETDSLCSRDAPMLMRVHWAPLARSARPPGLLMLSTDGLSKSFVDRAGFEEFARGFYTRLERTGLSAVQDDLPQWLARAAGYSGDDTTLVAAWYDRGNRKGRGVAEPAAEDSVYEAERPALPEDSE